MRDTRDQIVGLSLWYPTGRYPLSTGDQLAQLPGGLRSCNFRPTILKVGVAYSRATAPPHPKEPYGYLGVLMADPEKQGQGVGTALMDEALALIDSGGVGAYSLGAFALCGP